MNFAFPLGLAAPGVRWAINPTTWLEAAPFLRRGPEAILADEFATFGAWRRPR